MVRFESIRAVHSIVAAHDLEMVQFDIETAFLHGDLHGRNLHTLTLCLHLSGLSYLRLSLFDVFIRTQATCSFQSSADQRAYIACQDSLFTSLTI